MQKRIRIGSRDSRLAVIQAEIVKQAIEQQHPEIQVEIITMKTTGDLILDKSLDQIGGKGLFVKELDQALLADRIDLSVHSLKDMPMVQAEELPIVAYSKREDPRDVIIYKEGTADIPEGGLIGSSSKRRTIQLQELYPNCIFQGIRGNVPTRLRKLQEENFDAIVLAAAGLRRLGMQHYIGRILEISEVLPAAGQGILAIQGRKGEDYSFLQDITCRESALIAAAERSFVRTLDGGCSSPVAAYAAIQGNQIELSGLYYDAESGKYAIGTSFGNADRGEQLGEALAKKMRRAW